MSKLQTSGVLVPLAAVALLLCLTGVVFVTRIDSRPAAAQVGAVVPAAVDAPEAGSPAVVSSFVDDAPTGGLSSIAALAADRAWIAIETLGADAGPPPPPPDYCPVPVATFIDSWGFARSGGRRHQGVDMMAPHGSPIYAPAEGIVTRAHSGLGGLSFYLATEDGPVYFGAHLSTLTAEGPVRAGQQIGTVGSTGNASSPHLHFEIEFPGQGNVNPYPYTAEWCTPGSPGSMPPG